MKYFCQMIAVCCLICRCGADTAAAAAAALGKIPAGSITYRDGNGILYSRNELNHLAKGVLNSGTIAGKSECKKAKNANPLPALKAFNAALQARGIKLLVIPVPPKAAVLPFTGLNPGEAMAFLHPYYDELRAAGIDVLDLSREFQQSTEPCYCRTDAHWNSIGIALAAEAAAAKIALRGNTAYECRHQEMSVSGDLAKSLNPAKPETETLKLQTVSGPVFADDSPILVIGDSHTLFLSTGDEMLARNAGFCERLAAALHCPVERIGVKGSAATAVRINLYRKAAKNPEWLAGKKVVIYLFAAREFTESTSGWMIVPVAKK